jgi:RNA recognition motif-containing protein
VQAASTRIYVGKLLYTVQIQDIEELVDAEGFEMYIQPSIPTPILTCSPSHSANIEISIDLFTSLESSYCSVDMLSPADAQQAMQVLPGELLRGRPLKLNYAHRDTQAAPDRTSVSSALTVRKSSQNRPETHPSPPSIS